MEHFTHEKSMTLYSSFPCGDMLLLYLQNGPAFSFCLIPAAMKMQLRLDEKNAECLIPFKLSGIPSGNEASNSLHDSPCMQDLKFLAQEQNGNQIITRFQYGEGLYFDHIAELYDGWLRVRTQVRNNTDRLYKFDLLSSFALNGISPFRADDDTSNYFFERVTAHWHHEEISMERAGLETGASYRFGETGTMPVTQNYPFAAVEDRTSGVLWGVLLEAGGPWMMEFTRCRQTSLTLSGGMPDRGFCGHPSTVAAGQTLQTIPAILTCVKGNILDLFNRLQKKQQYDAMPRDISPVYYGAFDDAVLKMLKQYGIRYYVLSGDQHTHGIEQIHAAGLIPGITLDLETIAAASSSEQCLLKQDGESIRVGDRVYPDLREPEVRRKIIDHVCSVVQKYHTGYLRLICPPSFCGGCDGKGTAFENQQQYTDSAWVLYAAIRQMIPTLFIEFTMPWVERLSAKWQTVADMFTSSAPIPDAAVPMAALDRQMLLPSWQCGTNVTLQNGNDLAGNLNASLHGRPVLSGDPTGLTDAEQQMLQEFMQFYQMASPVLLNGEYQLGHIIGDNCLTPSGWQMFRKENADMLLMVIHTFSDPQEELSFEIPENISPAARFPGNTVCQIIDNKLNLKDVAPGFSAAFLFRKS